MREIRKISFLVATLVVAILLSGFIIEPMILGEYPGAYYADSNTVPPEVYVSNNSNGLSDGWSGFGPNIGIPDKVKNK